MAFALFRLQRLGEGQVGSCQGTVTFSPATEGLDLHESFTAKQMLAILRGQPPEPISPQPVTVQESSLASASTSARLLDPPFTLLRQSFMIASLSQQYPTLPVSHFAHIAPLYPCLDLDIAVHWTVGSTEDSDFNLSGCNVLYGIRPGPSQSILDEVREAILGSNGKAVRSMYEETNRRKQLLLESVLEGPLAVEENPLSVRVQVPSAKRGRIQHSFEQG
jgi:hypothetical protein